jgi:predicted short-subunit dehydrogenase-like oxidoreductase (DUF2520 family)
VSGRVLSSSLSLVGPGRAGSAFGRSWLAAGGFLTEVIARDAAAPREAVERLAGGSPRGVAEAGADCDILVLAVPDDAIAGVASALAGRIRCRAAFHVSGALPASALEALRPGGAALGSLHPLRVFTGSAAETWAGAFVAIEGDAGAVSLAERIVGALGGRPHRIAPESKPLYHAAATLAAGGTVALISLAARAWAAAGIPESEARRALAELAGSAAAAAAARDFSEAFTGPVARHDRGTLRTHRDALAAYPDLLRVYQLLARETLARTAPKGGGKDEEDEVLTLLEDGPDGKIKARPLD